MPRAHGGDVSESELHGMAPTRMMGLPERAKLAEAWRAQRARRDRSTHISGRKTSGLKNFVLGPNIYHVSKTFLHFSRT